MTISSATPEPTGLTVTLLPPQPVLPLPELHGTAREVMRRARQGRNCVVWGAAHSGKTTVALHLLAQAVADGQDALILAPTRARADQLRQRAAFLLGDGGGGRVRVRTPSAFAFSVVATSMSARPDPLPAPVLLVGAEEDAELARLLNPEHWAPLPEQTVRSRAFRTQLRNLLARAGELGVSAEHLDQLGERTGIGIWRQAAPVLRIWDAQGRPSPQRRGQRRKLDSARLLDRACEALECWETDGVTVPPPIPDVVIVDDYQDCTAATARLLARLALPDARGHRSQIIVLGDPDVAVETFRGGMPTLVAAAEEVTGLGAERLILDRRYCDVPQLVSLWEKHADRLPVTGTARHRKPQPVPTSSSQASARQNEGGSTLPEGVSALVASSAVQETAHVAWHLRNEHITYGTPWEDMAVIVRSSAQVECIRRDLRQRGVPLRATTPAVLWQREPAAMALLSIAEAAVEGHMDDINDAAAKEAVQALLVSPLVGLTSLDLRRLRRDIRARYRTEHDGNASSVVAESKGTDEDLIAMAVNYEQAQHWRETCEDPSLATLIEAVVRAARIVTAVREVVSHEGEQAHTGDRGLSVQGGIKTSQSADGEGDDGRDDAQATSTRENSCRREHSDVTAEQRQRIDIEQLLWAAWDASECGSRWRASALNGRGDHLSSVVAEAAEHDLDVITALFKRAEVWAERHPGADAHVFLSELLSETLPSDSVAPAGIRPAGVAVLTPAAVAGQHWPVVAILGLNDGVWPNVQLRDTLTQTGMFVDVVAGRLPDHAPDQPHIARVHVISDERRMLLNALTRATRRLILTSCRDDDTAPSGFFIDLAHDADIPLADEQGRLILAPDISDFTLRGLIGTLRRALIDGNADQATPEQRLRATEAAHLLATFTRAGIADADPRLWRGQRPTSDAPVVDPGEPVTLSPSAIETLSTCPLRWFLTTHGGRAGDSPQQNLGNVIHAIAEYAQRHGVRGEDLHTLLDQLMPQVAQPRTWIDTLAATRAHNLIDHLNAYLDTVRGEVEIERPFSLTSDLPLPEDPQSSISVTLRGRIDRVEHVASQPEHPSATQGDRASVRIMDLKTGTRNGTVEDTYTNPQLATYRLAMEELGHTVVGAALVQLGQALPRSGQPVIYPPGAALTPSPDPQTGQDWARELIASAALSAQGPQLDARPNDHCERCPVATSCPAMPQGKRANP